MKINQHFDEPKTGRDNAVPGGGGIGDELLVLWQTADDNSIYGWLSYEAAPRLISHLAAAFGLQEADCEDCVSAAFERFQPAVRSRKALSNPYAYFFKIGINAARESIRARRAMLIEDGFDIARMEDAGDHDDASERDVEPTPGFAVAVVEDAVAELEVEEYWAVEVVRAAIEQLPPTQRRVVQALMFKDLVFAPEGSADFDYSANNTGEEIGMSAGAFRTNKHRAFESIRTAIPALIVELGLQPPERAEAAIFSEGRGQFMHDSDAM